VGSERWIEKNEMSGEGDGRMRAESYAGKQKRTNDLGEK
jgi:hypothetical protein